MQLEYTNPIHYKMEEAFNELLPESLTLTQYELAARTDFTAADWSGFLHDGQVAKWIEQELALVTKANMSKLLTSAADNDRSVGAAQMLNAMSKMDTADKAETNFFIYSFVPPTDAELQSVHVTIDPEWQPPLIIDNPIDEQTEDVKEMIEEHKDTTVPETTKQETKEVDKDEWFF